jgi:hypothetical protein
MQTQQDSYFDLDTSKKGVVTFTDSERNTELAPGSKIRIRLSRRSIPEGHVEFTADLVYPGGRESELFERVNFKIPDHWQNSEEFREAALLFKKGDDESAGYILESVAERVQVFIDPSDPQKVWFTIEVKGTGIKKAVSQRRGDIKGFLRPKE